MKLAREFVINVLVGGVLVVLPIYLAVLLLLKGVRAVAGLIHPIAVLLPTGVPADFFALLIVLIVCSGVGLAVRTRVGRVLRERMDSILGRLPGYSLFRSLTQQLVGNAAESVWKPALAEIEEALVPAFIVEELDTSRYTVFVPSAPTPFTGAVYVLSRARVHPIDVPFTQAVKAISQWGAGSKELVAAMEKQGS